MADKLFGANLRRQISHVIPVKGVVPTKLSDLENDKGFVIDPDYVHTDNNYTDEDKSKLLGLSGDLEQLAVDYIDNIVNPVVGVEPVDEEGRILRITTRSGQVFEVGSALPDDLVYISDLGGDGTTVLIDADTIGGKSLEELMLVIDNKISELELEGGNAFTLQGKTLEEIYEDVDTISSEAHNDIRQFINSVLTNLNTHINSETPHNEIIAPIKDKLITIESGAQVNKLEKILFNGIEQQIVDKGIDITQVVKDAIVEEFGRMIDQAPEIIDVIQNVKDALEGEENLATSLFNVVAEKVSRDFTEYGEKYVLDGDESLVIDDNGETKRVKVKNLGFSQVDNTILELDELPEGDSSYSGKIVKVGEKVYVGSYKEWEETTTETLEAFTPFQVGDNLFDYTPHINTNLELNDEVVPTVLGETDLIIFHPDKLKFTMFQEDNDGIEKYITVKLNVKPGIFEDYPEGGWQYVNEILYMSGSYSEIKNEQLEYLFDIETIEEFNLVSEGGFTQEDATITYINDDPQWQTLLDNMGFNIEYEETNTEQKSEFTWIELTNKKYVDTTISQAITGVLEGEV